MEREPIVTPAKTSGDKRIIYVTLGGEEFPMLDRHWERVKASIAGYAGAVSGDRLAEYARIELIKFDTGEARAPDTVTPPSPKVISTEEEPEEEPPSSIDNEGDLEEG
jgi:hypothetical protein